MKRDDRIKAISATSIKEWRKWLDTNHDKEKSVWLIIYHKDSKVKSIDYEQAVEEALCYGWIDSKPNKRDGKSYFQFFAKRNPKSNWSRKNRETVEKLIASDRMQPSGIEMVRIEKENGTWLALEDVENGVIPQDLKKAFDNNKIPFDNYKNFPPSSKRIILEWIFNAKREETRQKRIADTVLKAENNIKANHYRQ